MLSNALLFLLVVGVDVEHVGANTALVKHAKNHSRSNSVATAGAASVTSSMRAVRKTGFAGCGLPDFRCVEARNDTKVPTAGLGEVLIRVSSSGLNPDEVSLLALPAVDYTLGIDVAGTVEQVGPGCSGRVKVGDRVWAPGTQGGFAEFCARPELIVGVLPSATTERDRALDEAVPNQIELRGNTSAIDMSTIGVLPTVALTSMGALLSAGAPWRPESNVSVIITAGNGGTGCVLLQLARAFGAGTIVTAATGDGIALAQSLGADVVVDYTKQSVYMAPGVEVVNVVISNHKSSTTAAQAIAKLAANPQDQGGVYVTLDNDIVNGTLPPNVTQIEYDMFDPNEVRSFVEYFDTLGHFLLSGSLKAIVETSFSFEEIHPALVEMAGGDVLSKLAVVPPSPSVLL